MSSPRLSHALPLWRPRTRGDCEDLPRPCVFVGCRYNTFLAVNEQGRLRPWARRAKTPNGVPAGASCALDAVEGNRELSRRETAELLGFTSERIRQLEISAIAKLKATPEGRALLRDLLEQMKDSHREPDVLDETSEDWDANQEDVSHAGALARQASEEETIDAWAERVIELRAAGLPILAAWSKATHEEDGMASKKGSKRGAKKKKAAEAPATKVSADELKEAVKIGKVFTARHPVTIDPARRDKVSEELVATLGEIDEVNEERSAKIGVFNDKLKELRERAHELAEAHRTSKEKRDVKCQQYMVPGNRVIVRRLDTDEIVEDRTATGDELNALQTKIPGSGLDDGED